MEPKGRDIMVTISISHPRLVWGPWMPMPPKNRKMEAAARRPVARRPGAAFEKLGSAVLRLGLRLRLRAGYFHVMRRTPTKTPVTET